MAKGKITRRKFVGDASAAVAFTVVPRHVLGRGFRAPSDILNIACIGVGGRGREDVNGVASENVYALCDVDDVSAAESYAKFPKAKRYKDFRELIEKEAKHIDAVTVAIPDHNHAAAAILAMKAGKHVYCEKPLARTREEVRAMMDVAKKSKVVTQMGNQGHAGEGVRQIREWVEAGAIGTVREVQLWTNRPIWPQALDRPLQEYYTPATLAWDLWLGPASARPYNPAYAPFKWRGWWDFGTGALGDMACHIMDAAFWVLDLGYPTRVEAESTQLFAETAPASSRITYSYAARGNRPAVNVVWRDGSLYPPRPPEVPDDQPWPPENSAQLWIGTEGKLYAGTYAERPRLLDPAKQADITAHPLAQKYPRSPGVHQEWIAACKGQGQANSSFAEYSGPLTEMVLLGNLAVRTGRPLEISPEAGQITNVKVPDEYVRPIYRTGWSFV